MSHSVSNPPLTSQCTWNKILWSYESSWVLPSWVQRLSSSSSLTPGQPSWRPSCSFNVVLPQGICTYCLYSLKFLPPGTCLVPSGHLSCCSNVTLSETPSLTSLSQVESLPHPLHHCFPVLFYHRSLISTWYTFLIYLFVVYVPH